MNVQHSYIHCLAVARKRKNYKRPAAKFPYGCDNYFWLKPGTDDVVMIGNRIWTAVELVDGSSTSHRGHPEMYAFMPVIELHPDHAVIKPRYTESDMFIRGRPTHADLAKALSIPEDRIREFKNWNTEPSYMAVDISLNNILQYLEMPIWHSGTGRRNVPGLYWHKLPHYEGYKRVHTRGPIQFNYDTGHFFAIEGTVVKNVQEPERLALNKRIREAMKKIRAVNRMGATFNSRDVPTALAKRLITSSEQLYEFVQHMIDPNNVLKYIEDANLGDMDSVMDMLMSISAYKSKRLGDWHIRQIDPARKTVMDAAGIASFENLVFNNYVGYILGPQWANQPKNLTSSGLAWLRQGLQHDLNVVTYKPEQ